jgi:hypothetical protein
VEKTLARRWQRSQWVSSFIPFGDVIDGNSAHPFETDIGLAGEPLRSAQRCNSVEDNVKDIQVNGTHLHLAFQPNEVLPVRLVR